MSGHWVSWRARTGWARALAVAVTLAAIALAAAQDRNPAQQQLREALTGLEQSLRALQQLGHFEDARTLGGIAQELRRRVAGSREPAAHNPASRLQRLAENYLELVPLLPSQIGLIGDIPLRDAKFDITAIFNVRPRLASAATRTAQSTGKRAQTRGARANGRKTIGRKLAAGRIRVKQHD